MDVRDRTGRLIQEAVMVRTHPRWLGARDLVRGGRVGELRAITGFFSYHNVAPENVRNRADIGGRDAYPGRIRVAATSGGAAPAGAT